MSRTAGPRRPAARWRLRPAAPRPNGAVAAGGGRGTAQRWQAGPPARAHERPFDPTRPSVTPSGGPPDGLPTPAAGAARHGRAQAFGAGVRAGRCRRRARVCASRAVRCGVVVCDRRPRAWSDRSAGGSLPDRPRGRRRALPRRARCAGGRARPPDARQQLNELQFGRQLRATNVTRQHRHTERIRLPREQP